jgi:hypothetical protein
MNILEKSISNLIESQFPEIYREEGPVFVEFVKKYYEWLEQSNNVLYHSRRLFEYKDVDETVDNFILYFKEQYLKNIQLETVQSTRDLIKHSLDLYRSKGSERSIELLFRVIYGVDCKIYYPGDDLFRTSDGEYHIPKYIEVSPNSNTFKYAGKGIIGVNSKAIAFVERVIRKNENGKISDIFYVSSIKGNFKVGEQLDFYQSEEKIEKKPFVVGSLTALNFSVAGKGSKFKIGDIISLNSNSGFGAKARVTGTSVFNDKLNFSITFPGYGYTNQSISTISTKNITIDNISVLPERSELLYQPLANLHYLNADGIFSSNLNIFSYSNNIITGAGKVISATSSNSSSGYILVEILSGNLNSSAIYSTGNTISANLSVIDGYTDLTATGKIIGFSVGNNNLKMGISNVVNQFYLSSYVYSSQTHLNGLATKISLGAGGNVSIYPSFINVEEIVFNTDKLKDFANTALNDTSYNFIASPSANISSPIKEALTTITKTVGTPKYLSNINPGHDYNEPPFVEIIDNDILNFHRHNITLGFDHLPLNFVVGEIITQPDTNARGLVLSSNSTSVYIENLRIETDKQFQENKQMIGYFSGLTANVNDIVIDYSSRAAGENCIVNPGLPIVSGAIVSAKIIDSGFNFHDNEEVEFTKDEITDTTIAVLGAVGTGSGYYKKRGSQPSGQKKLRDSEYYQEYSYDIISSIMLEKYSSLLKQTIHTAGFKFFGTLSKKSSINMDNIQIQSKIQISS